MCSVVVPSRGAIRVRSSRLVNPCGSSRWMEQGLQQGVHAGVAEAQPGDAGAGLGDDRRGQIGERSGAADRVVAEALDAEQAPVGGEADLPQRGQVAQPFRQPEIAGSLIVVSVRSALPSLWY